MNYYDVFNGDADGICSLIQLRKVNPRNSTLVTGVKRDISLLERVVGEPGDIVTALDISFEKNASAVNRLLESGVQLFYADHHKHGDIPDHPNLEVHIDTDPHTCTALIVDRLLQGRYREWAITAAFGDNHSREALELGHARGLSEDQLELLETLGICINYNGYGGDLNDLFYHPAELYLLLLPYESPLEFVAECSEVFETLQQGYKSDLEKAGHAPVLSQSSCSTSFMLPDERWARRVGGVFGNELANQSPDRAHAVVTDKGDGSYQVSVRAPLNNKQGADLLVSRFPTGGGRKAAAGINKLPEHQLDEFLQAFEQQYSV